MLRRIIWEPTCGTSIDEASVPHHHICTVTWSLDRGLLGQRLKTSLVPTRTSWYDLLIIIDYYHGFSFFLSCISRGPCNNWHYLGHVKHVDYDDEVVTLAVDVCDVTFGTARRGPRPLLVVPNVTAHPSTASVLITVLLYNGPLFCGFNVPIKGLKVCWHKRARQRSCQGFEPQSTMLWTAEQQEQVRGGKVGEGVGARARPKYVVFAPRSC